VNASCRNFLQMIRKFTDFFTESADEAADWLRGFAYKFQRQEWRPGPRCTSPGP